MPDLSMFEQYYKPERELLGNAFKDDLAECAIHPPKCVLPEELLHD